MCLHTWKGGVETTTETPEAEFVRVESDGNPVRVRVNKNWMTTGEGGPWLYAVGPAGEWVECEDIKFGDVPKAVTSIVHGSKEVERWWCGEKIMDTVPDIGRFGWIESNDVSVKPMPGAVVNQKPPTTVQASTPTLPAGLAEPPPDMKWVRVPITATHKSRGQRRKGSDCIAALALQDAFPDYSCSCSSSGFTISDRDSGKLSYQGAMPKQTGDAIDKFDNDVPVEECGYPDEFFVLVPDKFKSPNTVEEVLVS